jgi:hypothetical protein
MSRLLAFATLAAALAIVGVAVGVAVRGDGDPAGPAGPRAQDPIVVTTKVAPDGHPFGHPVVAKVDVRVDSAVVDPAHLRLEPAFDPYEVAGSRTVERIDSGRTTRLTYTYQLRCLDAGCEPLSARGVVEFPESRVAYRYRGDSRQLSEAIEWRPFIVTGRVSERSVLDIGWRAEESALAAVTYRARPGPTALVLLALAALLAAGAAGLAWKLWGGRRGIETESDEPPRTPLAVVLEAARAATANGDLPGRRRALESVARELGRVGLVELAADARTLAWSPGEASRDEVEELARRSELAAEGSE